MYTPCSCTGVCHYNSSPNLSNSLHIQDLTPHVERWHTWADEEQRNTPSHGPAQLHPAGKAVGCRQHPKVRRNKSQNTYTYMSLHKHSTSETEYASNVHRYQYVSPYLVQTKRTSFISRCEEMETGMCKYVPLSSLTCKCSSPSWGSLCNNSWTKACTSSLSMTFDQTQ